MLMAKKQEQQEIEKAKYLIKIGAKGQPQHQTARVTTNMTAARKGIIGQYLPTKKADFSEEAHKLKPEYVHESQIENKDKYVDLSIIRKGLNYYGSDAKKIKEENQEIAVA